MMKKAIVTGANGFIGTALCKELSNQGVEVIAVVKGQDANIDEIKVIKNLTIVYCDLSQFRYLASYVNDRDVDVLFHLAWIGSAGKLRSDYEIQIKNVQYTCDTVKACSDMNCKRIVFASSIMEYEISAIMDATNNPEINTLYSSAKVAANGMARTIAGSMNIEYIRGVISNIYGPGETSPRLINTSIRNLLNGVHCSFSEATQLYDFIYITDAVKMFVQIGQVGLNNHTYYIGNGQPRQLKEFLLEMRDVVSPGTELGIGDFHFEGVSLHYDEFDMHAVENETGFVPEVSYSEGIRRTMNWIEGC